MENLTKLTKLLGADRIMTTDDVQQILLGIMEILKTYKQGTETINEDTKAVVNSLLEQTIKYNQETISDFKSEAEKSHNERMQELQGFLSDVKVTLGDMEVMISEVEDGKDADEERVIGEVINKIKIDPTIVTMSSEEIRDKLASLKDEDRLDKSTIKGLEKILQQKDLDYAIATLQHQASFLINKGGVRSVVAGTNITVDNTDPSNPVISSTGGGASPLTTKGDLYTYSTADARLGVGANGQVLTADSAETTGLKWTTVAGTGDVVGPASSTDNAVARYDSTTGKLIQNSGVTISDTNVISSAGNIDSSLTASEILGTNGSKQLVSLAVATYPSLTELTYVKGVTSAIQTQINTKAPSTSPTFATSITGSYLTASEILITDGSKNIVSAAVATYPSLTELTYLKGVTSAIQTQLNAKGTGTVTSVGFTGGIISIADPTTTPALTVAGTSGGIPYFSSASTWATSAALAANAIVIGGGAGVAPATTTTGTGVLTALGINVGSAGAFVTFNGALGTPSSGTVTNLTGTASININGTVGATTPTTGVFTTATINTGLVPDADDGAYLGQAGTAFSDLFLAEGAVINWDSGDATITQTGNVLAIAGADLRVATAGVGTDADSVPTLSSTSTLTNKTLTSPTLTTPSAFTTGGTITLAENTSIALDPAGSADGKWTGITVTGVSGYSQAFGDLVTLDKDDSRWEAVDISVAAAATGDARGIMGMVVSTGTDGNACTILLQGIIRADANFPALTIGAAVYASTTGDIVVTQPSTTDYVIRIVGSALTADEIYFNPDNSWITHT